MKRQIGCFVVVVLMLTNGNAEDDTTDVRLQNLYADYCSIQNLFQCRREKKSCCIGCSCQPHCGLTANCCYEEDIKESPVDNRNTLIESGSLKCLYPNTRKTNNERFLMYQFIVGPPKEGCNGTAVCNQSDRLILWKTFQPIFSREKMVNYLNEECAKCHGVTDGLTWNSRLIMANTQSFDITTIVPYLIDNPEKSDSLYITFEHPGAGFERIQTTCLTDTTQTCLNDANQNLPYYPDPKNQLIEELEGECLRRFRLPGKVLNLYQTELCKVCYNLYHEDVCGTHFRAGPGVSFTTIFDFNFVGLLGKGEELQTSLTACKAHVKTNSDCREVLCPSMQVRNSNGKCDYPTETWYFERIGIYLNLSAFIPEGSSPFISNMSESEVMAAFRKTSPWSNCWTILTIVWRTFKEETQEILEFVVFQMCNIQSVDPRRFLASIQQSLSSFWLINLGEIHLKYKQKVALYSITPYLNYRFAPLWFSLLQRIYQYNQTDLNVPIWDVLVDLQTTYEKYFAITKPFFCNLVQLKDDEYFLHETFFLELHTPLKTLHHFEISINYLDKVVINVCIEDLNLEIVPHGVGGSNLVRLNFSQILKVLLINTVIKYFVCLRGRFQFIY